MAFAGATYVHVYSDHVSAAKRTFDPPLFLITHPCIAQYMVVWRVKGS